MIWRAKTFSIKKKIKFLYAVSWSKVNFNFRTKKKYKTVCQNHLSTKGWTFFDQAEYFNL